MVDRGTDLYLRRLRTLLTIPIQVKAFRQVGPDGSASLDLLPDEVKDDPNGYLLLIPSEGLPDIGYSETITVDPLTKRFVGYRVPSKQLGSMFLKKVFGA